MASNSWLYGDSKYNFVLNPTHRLLSFRICEVILHSGRKLYCHELREQLTEGKYTVCAIYYKHYSSRIQRNLKEITEIIDIEDIKSMQYVDYDFLKNLIASLND